MVKNSRVYQKSFGKKMHFLDKEAWRIFQGSRENKETRDVRGKR